MPQPLTHLGEIFREDFLSPFHVAENGGVITGNPVINNGYQSDGTADYIRYQKVQWSNIKDFSVWIDIEELKSVGAQAFISGDIVTSPLIRLINSTTVQFFPNQSSFVVSRTIPEASVGDTFKLGVSYNSATLEVNFYLNGSKLGALTAAGGFHSDPGSLELFARLGALDISDAAANRVSIYNRILTDDDFAELYDGTFSAVPSPIRHFAMQDKIGSSAPFTTSDTTGRSSAVLGDGSTSSTFPTKLTNTNGYSFDGGDYLVDENADDISFTGAFWLAMWVKGSVPTSNRGYFTKNAGNTVLTTQANTSYELSYFNADGNLYFQVSDGTTKKNVGLAASSVFTGAITLVVAAYDGTANADALKIYAGGREVVSGSGAGLNEIQVLSDDLWIGGSILGGHTDDMYQAFLGEGKITETQVKHLYSQGPYYLGMK